jgi:spermidine synthase
MGPRLTQDPRCELVLGNFFAFLRSPDLGLAPLDPGRKFDGIFLDIDHSPTALLHPAHAALYTTKGLKRLAEQLRDGGVFAMWSNDPPDATFQALLATAFVDQEARTIEFDNPLQGRVATSTIYLASQPL